MKKRNILILFSIAAAFVYFFLVPISVKRERYLAVDWRVTLTPENAFTGNAAAAESNSRYTPLLLDDYLCYVNKEGAVGYAETRLQSAALGDEFFINYSSIPERLLVKGNDGRIASSIDTRGYPHIESGRLFVFHQDRCGISEYTSDGELLWSKRFASIITSFSSSDTLSAVGLLDGRLLVVNPEGVNVHVEPFRGGRYNTVYGCAVDSTGGRFAGLVGSSPQRLVVFEKVEGEYELVSSEVLKTDFRREAYVEFLESGLIVYEREEALRILDLEGPRSSVLTLHGRVLEAYYDREKHLIFAVSAVEEGTDFTCFDITGRKISDYRFPGTVHIRRGEDALFLTNGNSVFRITVWEA
ncbi:MAG: hypothetical protein ACLFRY_11240 [Spirochaetia bacterium]